MDRFKFRVWNTSDKKYFDWEYLRLCADLGDVLNRGSTQCQVIEQCTGLKDKNGTLIFEGDIVELTRSRNYGWCKRGTKLKVQWNTFSCCGFGFGGIGNLTQKCAENCIVIGNIHENPELLESEGDSE